MRLAFFALGLSVSAAVWLIEIKWLDISQALIDPEIIYDTRPTWLHGTLQALFYLPVVVLSALIIVRFRGNRTVRPMYFALGATSLWVFLFAQLFLRPGLEEQLYAATFETHTWRENVGRNSDWPARLRMVDDLIGNHDLQGLSQRELEALLGPADETGYFANWDLVYWLGPERGFIRIDSEWLVVRLDTEGRVSEYRIARD